ncbi:YbaB/EbfC family nucleoid-associated protein [Actinoplanes sp. NPDC049599]|uniref:YbaB/EbfC family nucleoid-associated protein n=1 Tax=Actinoplanes sp. NPDC049599 TaxID=3363903 RepID=UPI003788398C
MDFTHTDADRLQTTLDDMLAEVRASTERVNEMQRELQSSEITGYAGNGEVTVRLLGTGQFVDVCIDPDTYRRYDAETVGTLVLTAVNDGLARLQEASRTIFAPVLDAATER